MTDQRTRTAMPQDAESQPLSGKPNEDHELDAEIVRDLEVDAHAEDVRGGVTTCTIIRDSPSCVMSMQRK